MLLNTQKEGKAILHYTKYILHFHSVTTAYQGCDQLRRRHHGKTEYGCRTVETDGSSHCRLCQQFAVQQIQQTTQHLKLTL